MSDANIQSLIAQLSAKKFLGRPDWEKRVQAANRLGELKAIKATAELSRLVDQNEHETLTMAALKSLGKIGNEDAISTLVSGLNDHEKSELHPAIVATLQEIGQETIQTEIQLNPFLLGCLLAFPL